MKLIQTGGDFKLVNITSTPEKLPPGNYILRFIDKEGYILSRKEDFILPKRIFGDHHEVDRWIESYQNNTEKNLGIILSGLKGTGKTVTCQMLCNKLKKPVIMINEAFKGSDFIDFLTAEPFMDSIIFVDEFEKIYFRYSSNVDEDEHMKSPDDFLSLMDGNYQTRFLFLLTVNDMFISDYLINRPGRVKYRKDFDTLPDDVMHDVIAEMLVDKSHKESIIKFFDVLGICTFDLLVALIKDMNFFKQDAMTCGRYFNVKAEELEYDVVELKAGGKIGRCYSVRMSGTEKRIEITRENPLRGTKEKNYEDTEAREVEIDFSECTIEKKTSEGLILVTPEKFRFKLTKQRRHRYAF